MAGESPDRSKQRESSAEPTSGSTGPVPEARTEEHGAGDPRLAVARDTGAPDGTANGSSSGSSSGSGETGPRGGVDTATRVFSVRDLAVESGESGESGRSEAGESGEAESGESEAGESGRAAGAEGASTGDAGGSDDSEGSEGTGAAEGSAEAATGDSAASADDDAVADAAVTAGGNASADSAATSDSDATTDADAGQGDARLRAAVAAWVRSGDSGDSGGDEAAAEDDDAADDAGAASAADGEQSDEAAADATGADDAAAEPSSQSDTEPEPDAGSATEAEGDESEAARADGEDAAAQADDLAEADAGAESGTAGDSDGADYEGAAADGGDEAAAKADAGAESGTATDAGSGAEVEDVSTGADAEPESGTAGDSDAADGEGAAADGGDKAAAQADAGPESDTSAGSDADDEEPEAPSDDAESAAGDGGGAGRVDQPTAVFKRPSKAPQVDQPTTMLKFGGAPKAPEKATEKATEKGPEKAPEPSAAERTSKFVALKPLDEPSTRKPADATSPAPQVGPERTAQQPLPPKPPLDLLAELTNTPPPPQTPVRTIFRRVKIWTPLVLLLAVVFAIAQAVRPLPDPTLALTADDSYTFDGTKADLPWPSEGQGWMDVNGIGTMGDFGKQTPVAIGSVAKAMTAYIILKDHPLKSGEEGAKITVDATAEKEGGYDKDGESTLNSVKEGDTLTEKQALSAIMIPSANNVARLLARWDSGSEAAFIKKMNDTAKELGMKNTTYTDASGLKETTVSSAEDQVKLGNELVKIPALTDITKAPSWKDPSGHSWSNYNRLVPYNGAIGIKTGTTTKAGGNLLFAATKEVGGETVTVVGAILGQHTAPIIDTVNGVSKTAMLAAQSALTSTKILKKGDVVGYVDDQLGGDTPIVLTKDVTAVGWAGLKVKLSFAGDDVPHTAKAGTKVGTLTVGDGTGSAVKVPVALQKDLTEPGFAAKLTRIL